MWFSNHQQGEWGGLCFRIFDWYITDTVWRLEEAEGRTGVHLELSQGTEGQGVGEALLTSWSQHVFEGILKMKPSLRKAGPTVKGRFLACCRVTGSSHL